MEIFFDVTLFSFVAATCSTGWVRDSIAGKCYYSTTKPTDFNTAKQTCIAKAARLVEPRDSQSVTFLQSNYATSKNTAELIYSEIIKLKG